MIRSTAIAFVLSPGLTLAQGGPPAYQPLKNPLVTIRAEGVQQILKQWPNTRLGRLVADVEVTEAVQAVMQWTQRDLQRRAAIRLAVQQLELDLEPWQIASMYTSPNVWQMFRHPLEQLSRFEFAAGVGKGKNGSPSTALTFSCLPRFEGRWTQRFEQEARQLRQSPWFVEEPDAKIDGYPAYVFTPPESEQQSEYFPSFPMGRWLLHLPGTFAYGSGAQHDGSAIGTAPAAAHPGLSLRMDLAQYVKMFELRGGGIPREFAALGFDGLKQLQWRARFVDELLLDEFEVELSDAPKGLVGALLTGTAELPPQALPKGAIVQLRCAVNLEMLAEVLPILTDGTIALSDDVIKDTLSALDGGIAVGLCAPAAGGLIPRMFLSLNVRDEAALDRVLAQVAELLPTRQVKYGSVECTILKIPDLPSGIQPAFCRLAGKLHIAESGRSLRTFLKAQQPGIVAMPVGDAPVPDGRGERLASLDLRFDEVQLYRSFRDTWLPLYSLVNPGSGPAPITRDDMPSVEVIAEHCGPSRGVLRRDGNRFTLQHLGVLGGPEAAALAMTWGPMISANMRDSSIEQLGKQVANHKLEAAWLALETFQKREQRWPKDLAELFTTQKLAQEALLLPADDLAETFELPNGQSIQTSFRYYPEPIVFANANGENTSMLLVEIRRHPWNRAVLNIVGVLPDIYGPESSQPIGQLGK